MDSSLGFSGLTREKRFTLRVTSQRKRWSLASLKMLTSNASGWPKNRNNGWRNRRGWKKKLPKRPRFVKCGRKPPAESAAIWELPDKGNCLLNLASRKSSSRRRLEWVAQSHLHLHAVHNLRPASKTQR